MPVSGRGSEEPIECTTKVSHYEGRCKNNTNPVNKLLTCVLGGRSHLEPFRHWRLGLLKGPLQPEEGRTGVKKTVIRQNTKNQENKNNSIEELTPQGEWLAYRCLDYRASSHPASRPPTPRGQALVLARHLPPGERREWRSWAGLPLVGGRGAAMGQRPRRLGLSPATRL